MPLYNISSAVYLIKIKDIIDNESIITHFQPIISLKDKKIVGIEALSRGISAESPSLISPISLLDAAANQNLSLDLDRLFRRKAFENYQVISQMTDVLLFLNVDTKILDNKSLELGWTYKYAESLGLKSKQIAIEICESKIEDTEKLIKFVENYRKCGFIIAIDDFGNSHSNLERIIQVKPDIIKISRALVDQVHKDFYKEAIVRSIVHLAKNVGAVTIAEGVENNLDVLKCHELGIDLYQGFYFAQPSDCCITTNQKCREKIYETLFRLTNHMKEYIHEKHHKHNKFLTLYNHILNKMKNAASDEISSLLSETQTTSNDIECVYMLDAEGKQTHIFNISENTKPFHQHQLFQKVGDGSDHSLKDYFVHSSYMNTNIFISEEFMSHTSKHFCKTVSSKFINAEGIQYTLCIDFIQNKRNDALMIEAVS